MNVVLFGASGMVGAGVLLECLDDPSVRSVLAVGRRPCGVSDPKLRELLRPDLDGLAEVEEELRGLDACFFCVGVSAAGMSEAAYRSLTYDLAIEVAEVLGRASPGLTFCYVSGQGTDSTAAGRIMWARVKGATENRLLEMPMPAYMFRPGLIQPLRGVRSRTSAYRVLYTLASPLMPALRAVFPRHVTTTVVVGRAMIRVAADGCSKNVLETPDINEVGTGP